ncbi:uncharacterized protein TRIADDRAFT_59978 [Trichoplax adhaerens]|uniref:Uncharacterized protein n=1 Tax=Trichoplax adhaerens TaxID=10228 RepID=B3S6Z1_TRIAD|nr:hypothetical protein TRIADDRAFT_59978 [Trichoplax adhaerens]EDV21477.1 hypothetical protein TRIADDRAFT_59978 [Trichoplax adhaerens]|eukprot:XP_002116077.1 hypothetical protein TRIADDRAFT_59978 [Trichoplax adhaerens]
MTDIKPKVRPARRPPEPQPAVANSSSPYSNIRPPNRKPPPPVPPPRPDLLHRTSSEHGADATSSTPKEKVGHMNRQSSFPEVYRPKPPTPTRNRDSLSEESAYQSIRDSSIHQSFYQLDDSSTDSDYHIYAHGPIPEQNPTPAKQRPGRLPPELPKSVENRSPRTPTSPASYVQSSPRAPPNSLIEPPPIAVEEDDETADWITVQHSFQPFISKPEDAKKAASSMAREGYLTVSKSRIPSEKIWVKYDSKTLKFYDNEEKNKLLDIVPVSEMKSAEIKSDNAKSGFKFVLDTFPEQYNFKTGTFEDVQLWVMALTSGIIKETRRVEELTGGNMENPTKAGYLKRSGGKKLFMVIKDQYICCYHNQQDYLDNKVLRRIDSKTSSVRIQDRAKYKFILSLCDKELKLQAENEEDMLAWISTIQGAIKIALQNLDDGGSLPAMEVKKYIYHNSSNRICADCLSRDPEWAVINLGITICEKCAGFHRKISTDFSKVKSITLDSKWTPARIKLFQEIGNKNSNKFFQYAITQYDKINPNVNDVQRLEFIKSKYVKKEFYQFSKFKGDAKGLGEALCEVVKTDNILETLNLLLSGADELLQAHYDDLGGEMLNPGKLSSVKLPPSSEIIKQGYLDKKGPQTYDRFLKRYFVLTPKELIYHKDASVAGRISVSSITDVSVQGNCEIVISTQQRSYTCRASNAEEAREWVEAITWKIKVFEVPIEHQDTADGIPYVVDTCIRFIAEYGLQEEGIYRKSGRNNMVEQLRKAFNADAANVVIDPEVYSVHDVASTLKKYFRTLPESIFTQRRSDSIICTYSINSKSEKIEALKGFLDDLPEVNYRTCRYLIKHLVSVSEHYRINLMSVDNLALVFTPTLFQLQHSNEEMAIGEVDIALGSLHDIIAEHEVLFRKFDDTLSSKEMLPRKSCGYQAFIAF